MDLGDLRQHSDAKANVALFGGRFLHFDELDVFNLLPHRQGRALTLRQGLKAAARLGVAIQVGTASPKLKAGVAGELCTDRPSRDRSRRRSTNRRWVGM